MKDEELIKRDQKAAADRLGRQLLSDATRLLVIDFEEETLRRIRRAVQFQSHCEDGMDIFTERNAIYADAFTQIGLLGICSELIGCVNRLKPLVLRRSERRPPWQQKEERELIRNTLLDAHNFANIALMMLAEDNWAGKD